MAEHREEVWVEDEFAGMSRDEEVLVRAKRQSAVLARQLARDPFAKDTVEGLRAYLAGDAEAAAQVWAALQEMPTEALAEWADAVCRVSRRQWVES